MKIFTSISLLGLVDCFSCVVRHFLRTVGRRRLDGNDHLLRVGIVGTSYHVLGFRKGSFRKRHEVGVVQVPELVGAIGLELCLKVLLFLCL